MHDEESAAQQADDAVERMAARARTVHEARRLLRNQRLIHSTRVLRASRGIRFGAVLLTLAIVGVVIGMLRPSTIFEWANLALLIAFFLLWSSWLRGGRGALWLERRRSMRVPFPPDTRKRKRRVRAQPARRLPVALRRHARRSITDPLPLGCLTLFVMFLFEAVLARVAYLVAGHPIAGPAGGLLLVITPMAVAAMLADTMNSSRNLALAIAFERAEAVISRVAGMLRHNADRHDDPGAAVREHPFVEGLNPELAGGEAGARHLRRIASSDPDETRRAAGKLVREVLAERE